MMDRLSDFFEDINALKHKERQGWKDIGVERPRDTIASHSYGAALMGWMLAEKEDADTEKVIKMLLVHDLVMSYVEDYTPEDEEYSRKKDKEKEVIENLIQDLPESIRDENRNLIEELRAGETKESVVAKEADKLDTLMQSREYSRELGEDRLSEFVDSYEEYFETGTGRKILKELDGGTDSL